MSAPASRPAEPLAAEAPGARAPVPWRALGYLLVVWIVWGSTYLGIRVAVREGSGFPPFTMAGSRILVAGGLMLLWAALAGMRLRLTRAEAATLAASGVLLWGGGNGLLVWAEQRADSGYAALLVSCTPIWAAAIEGVLDRRAPSTLLVLSLLVGLGGVALLSLPVLTGGAPGDVPEVVALLGSSVTWAAGTILQRRRPAGVTPVVSAGYQSVFAAVAFGLAALVAREPTPTPIPEAWLAWTYLVLAGSLVGFTSYIQVLRLLPTNVAMTYAYVNPAVAVLLGWLVLGEPVTAWTLAGMALVLAGVAGVFRARRR